jgi:DNA-directed RNA polymerase specialized sigma subunit
VPRPLHDLLAKVEHANQQSIGRLGRAASVQELAAQLEVSPSEILDARVRAQPQPDLPRCPAAGRRRRWRRRRVGRAA